MHSGQARREAGRGLCVSLSVVLDERPAFAQVELSGSYAIRMYEDYIERGPGSFMGDFTGHADERRGAREGAALHLEPSVDDRAAVPGAVAVGGTVPAARLCGSGASSTTAASSPG